jgi:hypothetical protein
MQLRVVFMRLFVSLSLICLYLFLTLRPQNKIGASQTIHAKWLHQTTNQISYMLSFVQLYILPQLLSRQSPAIFHCE